MQNRTILISGAGIAGPTLAFWLVDSGFTPTLVESAPVPRTGGYMVDFWGVGYDVAERMGILPVLQEDGYMLEEVRLVDDSGRRVAGFDASVFQSATNRRFMSILRGDLAHRIYESVADRIETVFSDSIAGLEEDSAGVSVAFDHSPERRFDLVVGADGLHSNVRTLAFGDSARYEKYLGYYTAAFTVDHYPHRDEGTYVSYSTPGQQVARYALRDGRSAFFFIFAPKEELTIGVHDVTAQRAVLRRFFSGAGWECDEILAAMDGANDLYFDAVAQTQMAEWSRGRIALLGDAAYCPSLLAGQGSALAMAGAYVLAHALASAPGDQFVAFQEYQRTFKPFVDAKQRAATRFGAWFAPRTEFGIWFRNVTTNVVGLPHVGEFAVRRSVGDRFELPG